MPRVPVSQVPNLFAVPCVFLIPVFPYRLTSCTGGLDRLLFGVAFIFLLFAGFVFIFRALSLSQQVGQITTSDPVQIPFQYCLFGFSVARLNGSVTIFVQRLLQGW